LNIYHDFEEAGHIRNAVVTTGSFDGVHIGHKVILERLKKLAIETGGETVLITFHPHPRKVLYPDTLGKDLQLINSQREKIELLSKAGVDNLIIVNFTVEFSKITSVEFVRDILLSKLHARKIVIGFNHHFGHNREGDYEKLRQLGAENGFEVEEIPEQDIHHETVSSTKIRQALLDGNIQKANAYLDHHYIIMGTVSDSSQTLAGIGFPSYLLQVEEEQKLVPPNGVYAVSIVNHHYSARAMCFVRKNVETPLDTVVEFYPIDPVEPLAGKVITLFFHKKIRGEKSFSGPDEMQRQLLIDKEQVEELIF
jgi:riboflavin kinase / FMN adenylyltransferase